jgi:hypothetical protein
MSAILYGLIHKRAESTYEGPPVTAANYSIWVSHWFKSAEEIAEAFDKESLPTTAKAVRDIVKQQERFYIYGS